MRPWAQGPARAVSLGSPLERRGETFTCKPCEAESRASDQLSQPLIDRSGNLPAAAARRDWAVCKARERPGDEQYSGTRGAEAAMRHLADGWVAGEARVGALPARAAEARAGAVHRGLHSHVWCSRTSRGNGWAARRGLEYWRPTPRRSERGLCIAACTRMSGAPAPRGGTGGRRDAGLSTGDQRRGGVSGGCASRLALACLVLPQRSRRSDIAALSAREEGPPPRMKRGRAAHSAARTRGCGGSERGSRKTHSRVRRRRGTRRHGRALATSARTPR
jgi:hypothetical protein